MNPEDVGKILDEIGERIGPAGAYAWGLAVRQVYIEGVIGTAVGGSLALLTAVALVWGLLFILRTYRQDQERTKDRASYDRTDPFGYAFAGFLVVGVGGAILGRIGTWALLSVQQLLNPEYHAMVRLLERLVP